ncbi:HAD family hydrolase [Acidobacteriota bacterium]
MRRLTAIIFDLDGTLIDSIQDLADSMNSVLESQGYPVHDTDSYKHMVGDGVRSLAERALTGIVLNEATIKMCLDKFKEEYNRRWATKTHPYEGIQDLLNELERRQIRMNILSNKIDHFTKLSVARFFPRIKFVHVLGVVPSLPKKPDPAGALLIAHELGIPPHQFLFLGDTNTDMMTAVAAGMFPVGVLWGFRSEKELLESGASKVIAHPSELLSFFDG